MRVDDPGVPSIGAPPHCFKSRGCTIASMGCGGIRKSCRRSIMLLAGILDIVRIFGIHHPPRGLIPEPRPSQGGKILVAVLRPSADPEGTETAAPGQRYGGGQLGVARSFLVDSLQRRVDLVALQPLHRQLSPDAARRGAAPVEARGLRLRIRLVV